MNLTYYPPSAPFSLSFPRVSYKSCKIHHLRQMAALPATWLWQQLRGSPHCCSGVCVILQLPPAEPLTTLPSEVGTTATAMHGPGHPLSPAQQSPPAQAHIPLCPQTSGGMGNPVSPSTSPSSQPPFLTASLQSSTTGSSRLRAPQRHVWPQHQRC